MDPGRERGDGPRLGAPAGLMMVQEAGNKFRIVIGIESVQVENHSSVEARVSRGRDRPAVIRAAPGRAGSESKMVETRPFNINKTLGEHGLVITTA